MGLVRGVWAAALMLGPLAWLRRTSALPTGWHPLLVLCGASVLVLASGMAGSLLVGVVLVVVVSLGTAVREFLLDRDNLVATVREPPTLALLALAVSLGLLLHGQVVTHYDNFSHWALVISVMLEDDQLPGSDDQVIGFPAYPLAAATLGYAANRLLGSSESVSMLAQALFLSACALPLVSAAGRRWWLGVPVAGVAVLALLTGITGPTNLLVDSLVAGLAAALLCLVVLQPGGVPGSPWAFALVSTSLVMVKASGVLFVLVACVAALALLVARRHQLRSAASHLSWVAALLAPSLTWALWRRHVAATFPDAGESKHSASLGSLGPAWAEKTADERSTIVGDLAASMAGDLRLWLLLLGLLLAGAAAVRARALPVRAYRTLLVTTLVTVLLWEASLIAMYLLSMPRGEALALAGFGRYQATLHLVLALLVLALAASWAGASVKLLNLGAVAGASAVVIVGSLVDLDDLPLGPDAPPAARSAVAQAVDGFTPAADDEVCLVLESWDHGYRSYLTRYLLLHANVRSAVVPPDPSVLTERLSTCTAVVLLDERPDTAEAIRAGGFPLPTDQEAPAMIVR